MKTIWMILLCAVVAAGCYASPENSDPVANNSTTDPVTSAKATNGVVTLHFDEVAAYSDLELRWLEIMDSRCPTGVTCIRAGDVKVVLEANRAAEKENNPVKLALTLFVRGDPITASALGYELELLSVHPYPINNVTPLQSNYIAEVKVSKSKQK